MLFFLWQAEPSFPLLHQGPPHRNDPLPGPSQRSFCAVAEVHACAVAEVHACTVEHVQACRKRKFKSCAEIRLNHAWPCTLEPDNNYTEEYVRACAVELDNQA